MRGKEHTASLKWETTAMNENWQLFADKAAEDAHRNHFASRRGVWYFEDADVLALYNNNPNAARDKELAELRRLLAAAGIKVLAFGTYPQDGPDASYTFAMILNASRDREAKVAELMAEAARAAMG